MATQVTLNSGSVDSAGSLALKTNGTTTAVTIDTSQNVGIGTASPTVKMQLKDGRAWFAPASENYAIKISYNDATQGVWLGSPAANVMGFYDNNGAERMRIDSSGNLLVGVTSGNYHRFDKDLNGDFCFNARNSGSSAPYGLYVQFSNASPNGATNEFIYCADSVNVRALFRSNGGLANYSGNNVNLSDRREKTNFAPAGDYLAKICAIPVQTFNYIDQNLEEDGGLTLGVVAQDVQAVAPELVMESNWAAKDEEPKMRLSIYQTDLQYALMKCIQEQQALITTLTDRITALEAK
jgi:hypothetical protein